ncbi:MAG: hypothetical protein HY821_06705 [Acidobacteria bacterium]|nr:hypothetical protein [Acidobacteriota bacterium]
MTFEEAGARYGQLRAQWQTGMLPAEQFQQMVSQLGVQDAQGQWWQMEPSSGQWMMWNGAQWVQAAQAQPAAPPPPPAQPAAPAYGQAYAAQYQTPYQTPYQAPYQAPPQAGYQATHAAYQPGAVPGQYGAQPPRPAMGQQMVTVPGKKAGPAIWEGIASVLPGFVIEMLQRWQVYQKDPAALAGFAVPSLLPGVLLPLVPTVGRAVSIVIVLGCLGWLSWPLISQGSEILGNAKAVQSHAGRGLVGVSLLYLIPRIWKAG